MVHASHPYKAVGNTTFSRTLSFVFLHCPFQIEIIFVNRVVAIASLLLISGVLFPFASILAPRYSKLLTLSISSPSIAILASFLHLSMAGPCQSTKNYIGEHRELSIIGTQEKDLNIIGGNPFADKATKKQEPKRKRGKRGGLRVKTRRRKSRPFLPVVVLGNLQSIRNKIDELQACAKYFFEYRESSVMCFSET